MNRREIARALARGNVFQPATVLWRAYEIEAVQRLVSLRGHVLDVGCGDGTLTSVVTRAMHEIVDLTGVEPDPIDAAAAERSGLYARVHCVAGAAIPIATGTIDDAFSNSVLEHIPELEPVLAEVARTLRPDGRFVLTVPSADFHACLAADGWLARRAAAAYPATIDRRLQHHRYWTEDEWRSALGAVGLRVEGAHRYFPRRAVQAWERLSNRTGGLLYELAGRRTQTRSLQRGLGLATLERFIPARAGAALLDAVLGAHLDYDDEPLSGGLLIVARR